MKQPTTIAIIMSMMKLAFGRWKTQSEVTKQTKQTMKAAQTVAQPPIQIVRAVAADNAKNMKLLKTLKPTVNRDIDNAIAYLGGANASLAKYVVKTGDPFESAYFKRNYNTKTVKSR